MLPAFRDGGIGEERLDGPWVSGREIWGTDDGRSWTVDIPSGTSKGTSCVSRGAEKSMGASDVWTNGGAADALPSVYVGVIARRLSSAGVPFAGGCGNVAYRSSLWPSSGRDMILLCVSIEGGMMRDERAACTVRADPYICVINEGVPCAGV